MKALVRTVCVCVCVPLAFVVRVSRSSGRRFVCVRVSRFPPPPAFHLGLKKQSSFLPPVTLCVQCSRRARAHATGV